jgi:hypothetical protein
MSPTDSISGFHLVIRINRKILAFVTVVRFGLLEVGILTFLALFRRAPPLKMARTENCARRL